MPWKEATKVTEREQMIRKWRSGLYQKSELAEEFGVTRPAVDLWIKRDAENEGLSDRSSAPHSCPHRTPEEIANGILEAKQQRPHWGPAKLIDWLHIEHPDVAWPAPSTAGDLLKAKGLVRSRRKHRTGVIKHSGRLSASESGTMMTADHKGQFRVGTGAYCYPVTITDPVSRFIYAITAAGSTSFRDARATFERVFREHGLPETIGTDNGSPFSCPTALAGISLMSAWWIKLGITPLRIHPGCPWENSIHERMHRTLKAETTRPPQHTFSAQQKRFDAFRYEYNYERPHETLNGRRPAEFLRPCPRPYPRRVPPVEYPSHYEVRMVRSQGVIKWKGRMVFISEVLYREPVGLVEIDDGIWSVYFSAVELGRYDARTKRIN